MRRHKIAAIYINRESGDMVFLVMSTPPTDTVADDDAFNLFMMYDGEGEEKDKNDDWSDLIEEQQAREQAEVAPQTIPPSGMVQGNNAPCSSSDIEPVVAPVFGGQLSGTVTSPPCLSKPVPIIQDALQEPSEVRAAGSQAHLPKKQMTALPYWPVHGGEVPRAGDWDGSEMEEVSPEEVAELEAQALRASSLRRMPHRLSTSYPLYMPTYELPPLSPDFPNDEEIPPRIMPTFDSDNDPYRFPVVAGDSDDDGTGLYDPDEYDSKHTYYAKTTGVGMRPPAALEFPDPGTPSRHVYSGHESRPTPAPTLAQTTYPPLTARTSRDEAAAMAKNVRNQRKVRSQMYGFGGGAASYRPPLPRAEFPTGMPHNLHRWDPVALTQAVFGEDEKTEAEKAEKRRIDDYQRLLSEDAGFALQREYASGYPTSQRTAHRSSLHSTASRAAFGGYQVPFAPVPTSIPHDDYGNFQLYGEDPFNYSTPAYNTPYRPSAETGRLDYQHPSAASQAMHDVLVTNFCEATQQTPDVADLWLRRFNGDYMQAVRSFFS